MATHSDRPSRTTRRRLVFLAKLVLVFSLLGWVVKSNQREIHDLIARGLDLGLMAAAFVSYMAGVVLALLRWHLLVRSLGLPLRIPDTLRLGFIGIFFNQVVPGAIGGDLVKTAYLCREQGARARPIASVVLDRIIGVLGLFLLAALAGAFGAASLPASARGLVRAAWIATAITTIILVAAFLPSWRRGNRHPKRLGRLAAVGASYRRRLTPIVVALLMALGTHLLNVLGFFLVDRALFPNAPGFVPHLVIVPLVLFTTAIPLPFGALGVSEQISARLFALVGPMAGALGMMGFRVLQFGGALIGLVVFLANADQVRELAHDAESTTGPFNREAARAARTSRRTRSASISE